MPVSLKPVIEELESLFSKFNKAFFEGKLEKPVITVSPDSTNGALHIGGRKYKLSIFTREGCARLHLGDRKFHFGNWGC